MDLKLLYQVIKNPISDLREIGYGTDNLKDSNPHRGQVYLALNTEKVYYCLVDGTWIEYNPLDVVYNEVLYRLPDADGITGQVLKTDGNKNLYWGDPGEGILPTSTIEIYNVINTIASGSQQTIVTYNNVGSVLWLSGCMATGDIQAEFVLMVNSQIKGTARTSEQDRTGRIFVPKDIKVEDGDIVTVKVTHWESGETGEFKATIYGYRL